MNSPVPQPQGGGGPALPHPSHQDSLYPVSIRIASYLLMAGALLLVMIVGMLPGLLAACLGFILTRWLERTLLHGARFCGASPSPAWKSWIARLACVLIIFGPVLVLVSTFNHYRGALLLAPDQFSELIDYLAKTVLGLRQYVPDGLVDMLPQEVEDLQREVAAYLWSKAAILASAGRVWLVGILYAYVGLLIGALAAVYEPSKRNAPLSGALRLRVLRLGDAFRQIIAAQFWIASFNTVLTGIFLLFVLPLFDSHLPYTTALITLTFVAGLIPIVGNLLCNVVITVVGLTVSPVTAVVCLTFLILIHKVEYFINAKVVGRRTHISVWELLAVMFMSEAVFGPAGLVAAPLFYAYLKKELEAARLV